MGTQYNTTKLHYNTCNYTTQIQSINKCNTTHIQTHNALHYNTIIYNTYVVIHYMPHTMTQHHALKQLYCIITQHYELNLQTCHNLHSTTHHYHKTLNTGTIHVHNHIVNCTTIQYNAYTQHIHYNRTTYTTPQCHTTTIQYTTILYCAIHSNTTLYSHMHVIILQFTEQPHRQPNVNTHITIYNYIQCHINVYNIYVYTTMQSMSTIIYTQHSTHSYHAI